jgi:polysaccharide biosynthesis transport protein
MALGFPLLLLVARDMRRQHVDTSQAVSDSLGLQILGSVPSIPSRYMRRLNGPGKGAQHWRWRLMEAVNSVAAMLLRSAAIDNRRVFLISSAESGEGKSTLANFLATSLAESGHRTLLIDFDLRRPTLHYAFNVSRSPGVSDVLMQKATLLDACVTTPIENLSLIPAGKWHGNLLAGSRTGALKELMAEARTSFDFVIVDGSPALAAVDSRLIGEHTDGVLLTVRKDISQMPRVVAACETLRSHGIRIVGTVLSGCDDEAYYDPVYHAQATAGAI